MSHSTTHPPASPAKVLEGVFAINKPTGLSSAQVLRDLQHHFDSSALFAPWLAQEQTLRAEQMHAAARRGTGRRYGPKRGAIKTKLGHGGTLDPLATGVLIVGVGKGTKALQGFLECTKSYECVVLFGAATDTYDTLGKIVARSDYEHVTEAKVKEALQAFRGTIMQTPPVYSALKVQGKKLYEYAREGMEVPVEIKPREVTVSELECLEWLEGGSHDYRWPDEEAPQAEKVIAQKLGVVAAVDSQVDKGSPGQLKRKRDETDESPEKQQKDDSTPSTFSPAPISATTNGTVTEPQAVENTTSIPETTPARSASPPPTMSGALPPTSTTTINSEPEYGPRPRPPPANTEARPPAARLRMTVTSGFYVRSLCHDLGQALGSAACMAALVRSRQQKFVLRDTEAEGDEQAVGGGPAHGSAETVEPGAETEAEDHVKKTRDDSADDGAQFTQALEYSDLARGEQIWGPQVAKQLAAWDARLRPQHGEHRQARRAAEGDDEVEGEGGEREGRRDREQKRRRNSSSSGVEVDTGERKEGGHRDYGKHERYSHSHGHNYSHGSRRR